MRNRLALAAVSALAILVPQVASSLICTDSDAACTDPFADRRPSTMFDLGVDVSSVPLTRQDVNEFIRTLSTEGQGIILKTCENYVRYPSQVQSRRTIAFCQVLLGK